MWRCMRCGFPLNTAGLCPNNCQPWKRKGDMERDIITEFREMKKYSLIVYLWRGRGRAEYQPADMAWDKGIADWYRYVAQFDGSEHILLNVIPISKSEYAWIKDNI